MEQNKEAKETFEKIISHGRTTAIRKAAENFWAAYNSDEGFNDEAGKNLEQAIKSIPIDYRQPTIQHLEELNNCKESNDDISSCYLTFAIRIVDRIVSII